MNLSLDQKTQIDNFYIAQSVVASTGVALTDDITLNLFASGVSENPVLWETIGLLGRIAIVMLHKQALHRISVFDNDLAIGTALSRCIHFRLISETYLTENRITEYYERAIAHEYEMMRDLLMILNAERQDVELPAFAIGHQTYMAIIGIYILYHPALQRDIAKKMESFSGLSSNKFKARMSYHLKEFLKGR